MNLFFYPDDSKILETWKRNSSFKYFRVIRIEKQIRLFVIGRSYCWQFLFRDQLTFNSSTYSWPGLFFCKQLNLEVNKQGQWTMKKVIKIFFAFPLFSNKEKNPLSIKQKSYENNTYNVNIFRHVSIDSIGKNFVNLIQRLCLFNM